jgi:hypothetical protein
MPTEAFFSQNKWPASPDPTKIGVRRFAVTLKKGVDSIELHPEIAQPLIDMIKWWDQNIEPVSVIHGHNWREIAGKKGTGKLSNHSSGTAIDINPDLHPLGGEGTVPAHKRSALLQKAASLGLRWGGSYPGRKDEMHFEWIKSPSSTRSSTSYGDVAQIARPNTLYVPPEHGPWYKNPWFYIFAAEVVVAVTVPLVTILGSRKSK